MDISKLIYIFIQGLAVGAGPCLMICAPLLLPYIASTQKTWQEGLRATLIFGLTRLAIYTLLGGVMGYMGVFLFRLFYSQAWGKFLWGGAGIFLIIIGILIMIGKKIENPICGYLQKQTIENSTQSLVLLGIVIGLSPCLPLMAILMEIMFLAEKFYQGFLYGAAFGMGTVISPLLLLGAAAPLVKNKLKNMDLVCGVLLVAVGIYILWQRIF